jgi:hypothetical protein
MNNRKRNLLILLVLLLVLAVPSTALANKTRYAAELRGEGAQRGSGTFIFWPPNGELRFIVTSRNLTSAATGVVLEQTDGTHLVTLCGAPAPSATGAACPADPAFFSISGTVTPGLLQQWGITGGQLWNLLNANDVYVAVYSANGFESRGLLVKQ